MSTFSVTLERVEVRPHPNADRLELARVGLYDAVVGKGQFATGDVVFYIPEQAILPEELITRLNLNGKLAGKAKNRVKAVSLRGALSQGIVASMDILDCLFDEAKGYSEAIVAIRDVKSGGTSSFDFSELLQIKKWQPEIPVHLSGDVESGADLLSWVDIENIKRYPGIFEQNEEVWVSEKIHGTCLLATVSFGENGEKNVTVSSKGLADKHLALKESEENLYWRAVNGYKVRELAQEIAGHFSFFPLRITSVGIYGEVYGSGIQDLGYGAAGKGSLPGFAVFDARVRFEDGTDFWVNAPDLVAGGAFSTDIPRVPTLYVGPYDIEKIAEIANGMESVSGTEANIREGVVIRPTAETRSDALFGRRKIAKFVTEAYLTRKGGTEYQ